MNGPVASERQVPLTGFEEYVERISSEILAYFARRVQVREDAADCLSETLLVLWRRRSDMPEAIDAKRAWTYGVAHGVLNNHQRSRTRRIALADRLRDQLTETQTVQISELHEVNDALTAALRLLKDIDRELVTLVAWEGMSLTEAAQVLGIKPAGARTRYSRARLRLRRALDT